MKTAIGAMAAVIMMSAACEEPYLPDEVHKFVDVTTGGDHTCAVTTDGEAYCWGRGADGELGTGSLENEVIPRRVASDVAFKAITAGYAHTCALDQSGRAYCWGFNGHDQLGSGTLTGANVPQPVDSNERFASINAGAYHTCGVTLDGRVICWGFNRWGQNGNGSTQATAPTAVTGNLQATSVSAGGDHTCAIDVSGVAFCWGSNDYGQLGIPTDSLFSATPVAVTTTLRFVRIAAGATHTCGIATDGKVYCWGSAVYGEIGDGSMFKPGLPGPTTPTPVLLLQGATQVSAGVNLSCAVDATVGASCWGHGTEGQTGSGAVGNFIVRRSVKRERPFGFTVLAAGGTTHACGIENGVIYCWGTGASGQLGTGYSSVNIIPERVSR